MAVFFADTGTLTNWFSPIPTAAGAHIHEGARALETSFRRNSGHALRQKRCAIARTRANNLDFASQRIVTRAKSYCDVTIVSSQNFTFTHGRQLLAQRRVWNPILTLGEFATCATKKTNKQTRDRISEATQTNHDVLKNTSGDAIAFLRPYVYTSTTN